MESYITSSIYNPINPQLLHIEIIYRDDSELVMTQKHFHHAVDIPFKKSLKGHSGKHDIGHGYLTVKQPMA